MLNQHRLRRSLLNLVTYFPFHFWGREIGLVDPEKTCADTYLFVGSNTSQRGCYFALHKIKSYLVEQQETVSLGVLSLLLSAVRKQLAGNVLHVFCFLVFLVLIFESMWLKAHSPQCTKSQVDFSIFLHQKFSMKAPTNVLKMGFWST